MSGIRYVYFDARARGETARLVLAKSGEKWEDCRHTFETWPAEKPNAPFLQLPFIDYKGKKFCQSLAIEFFLAQEFGLAGKTNLDSIRSLEITNLKEDFIRAFAKQYFEKDDKVKEELKKKIIDEDIPKFLGFFEKRLKENGCKGFFIGSALTLPDLAAYDMCDTCLWYNPKSLDAFPEVQKLRKVVAEDPKIKAYLAGRKKTDF